MDFTILGVYPLSMGPAEMMASVWEFLAATLGVRNPKPLTLNPTRMESILVIATVKDSVKQ